jgi:hypothetical protein
MNKRMKNSITGNLKDTRRSRMVVRRSRKIFHKVERTVIIKGSMSLRSMSISLSNNTKRDEMNE